MKKELEWESLEERRKVSRVSILHQALSGRLAIPTQTILRPVLRSSRHSQLIQIATNKNCLKYSFMPRTVIDWNSIPLHIKEIEDKDKFKAAVAQASFHSKGTAPTLLVPTLLGELSSIHPDPDPEIIKLMLTNLCLKASVTIKNINEIWYGSFPPDRF